MDLAEKLSEALDGEDLDDVIPALTLVLANAGSMACNDKDVFSSYVLEVIANVYDEKKSTIHSIQ